MLVISNQSRLLIFVCSLLSVASFAMELQCPFGAGFEIITSKEGNTFKAPNLAALLNPHAPHGLDLDAVELRYKILYESGYFSEKGHNREDISVDIKNLRNFYAKFGDTLKQAQAYKKYLTIDMPNILQTKLGHINNDTPFSDLCTIYEDIELKIQKSQEFLLKLKQSNMGGMEDAVRTTKQKILRVLGRENFPQTGITEAQLSLLPASQEG